MTFYFLIYSSDNPYIAVILCIKLCACTCLTYNNCLITQESNICQRYLGWGVTVNIKLLHAFKWLCGKYDCYIFKILLFNSLQFDLRVLCLQSGDEGKRVTVGYVLSDKFGEAPCKKLWICWVLMYTTRMHHPGSIQGLIGCAFEKPGLVPVWGVLEQDDLQVIPNTNHSMNPWFY